MTISLCIFSTVIFGHWYGLAAGWALKAYVGPLHEAGGVIAVTARGHHEPLVQFVLVFGLL